MFFNAFNLAYAFAAVASSWSCVGTMGSSASIVPTGGGNRRNQAGFHIAIGQGAIDGPVAGIGIFPVHLEILYPFQPGIKKVKR